MLNILAHVEYFVHNILISPRFVIGTYSEENNSIPHELARLKSPNEKRCLSVTIVRLTISNFLDHPGPRMLVNTAYSYVRN